MATNRQVPNCKVGLQHNIGIVSSRTVWLICLGLGGAVVVTLYKLGFPEKLKPFPQEKTNPAVICESPTNQAIAKL